MSEETPRLTRRQMREQGLLSAPADGPSVLDTTELRLRRPSRKELRELAEHATAQGRSVRDGDDYVGEPTQAMKAVPRAGVSRPGADPEPVQHERKSVFDRFEDPAAARWGSAGSESRQDTAVPSLKEPPSRAEMPDSRAEENSEDYATGSANPDTTAEGSLRDRFLAMTKRDDTDGVVEKSQGEEAVTPVAEKRTSVSEAKTPDEPSEEETVVEAPRRTWLNIIILVLIAALIGYLGGSWINVTFLSDPLPGVPADATYLLL
ncbi:hypothetical protein [Trueperella pyogenes]|uniref:hypothetical protein n=1 Tax=Trueperella pyogenes TaxID=1661 RepID=UPI00345D5DA2